MGAQQERVGLALLCGLAAAVAFACPALAQSPRVPPPRPLVTRELTVTNRSKQPVTELYVSPNDAPDWGDDRLVGHPVPPGTSFHVAIGRTRACLFDVQLVYQNGSHEEAHDYDLCHGNIVALDGSTASAVPLGPTHTVTLVNNDTRPIQQVFLSEAEAPQWGDDRVTSRGLSIGDRIEIAFQGGCAVDLRVIFDNRGAEERRALDICATPALSIEPGWTTADAPLVPAAPAKPVPAVTASAAPVDMARTTLRVANDTGFDVTALYLYPEGRADQGGDVLAGAVLRHGAAEPVTLALGSVCRFSAHVVFAGAAADREIKGLDLCGRTAITLPR